MKYEYENYDNIIVPFFDNEIEEFGLTNVQNKLLECVRIFLGDDYEKMGFYPLAYFQFIAIHRGHDFDYDNDNEFIDEVSENCKLDESGFKSWIEFISYDFDRAMQSTLGVVDTIKFLEGKYENK